MVVKIRRLKDMLCQYPSCDNSGDIGEGYLGLFKSSRDLRFIQSMIAYADKVIDVEEDYSKENRYVYRNANCTWYFEGEWMEGGNQNDKTI